MFLKIILLSSVFLLPLPFYSFSAEVTVTEQIISRGLERPWAMAFLDHETILINERVGQMRLIKNGALQEMPIKGLPEIISKGQGGLLGIALHPNFAENRYIYFSYVGPGEGGHSTEVARGKLSEDLTSLREVKTIFVSQPKMKNGYHFGSRLAFDNNGYLFISLGERNQQQESQNLENHLGCVIRLHDDGSIPKDNPFVGEDGARDEIYSYGHRNVQGLMFHPDGTLWSHEHGPRGGDEINIVEAGKNYGWPEVTYGINYDGSIITNKTHQDGMEQPIHQWTPSIAPCGMTFYTGDKYPEWKGDLFVGALAHRHLQRVKIANKKVVETEKLLTDLNLRIRDVKQGPDGYLYVLTDEPNGKLIKLLPG